MSPLLNRRNYRRTYLERSVKVVPLGKNRRRRSLLGFRRAPAPSDGKLVDIGCGGIAASVAGDLTVGTPVDVHINHPSGKVQRARGTIRSVRIRDGETTLGIAFSEPVLALGDPAHAGDSVAAEGCEPVALVVDDDPGVCQVLQRFLTGRGMRVFTLPSAEDGLAWLRQQEPALLMLDLRMDGMSGVEMLETMRAEGLRCTHVWAMSGSAMDGEAHEALSKGATEFIDKPFDLDTLDSHLQALSPIL